MTSSPASGPQQVERLKAFLQCVTQSLLDNPHSVLWQESTQDYPVAPAATPSETPSDRPESQPIKVIEMHVPKDEVGKIIGRSGRTADALRIIVQCSMQPLIARGEQRVHLQIVDA